MTPPVTPDQIRSHTLRNDAVQVTLLSLGCAVQRWQVAGTDVTLGYADPAEYIRNAPYLGVIVGRVANRISNARFTLDGETYLLPANLPPHCLHGGSPGFSHRLWELEPVSQTEARFTLVSEDGDQGFPGTARAEVRITLDGYALRYDMRVATDRPTPINLAQHLYFNLMGTGSVMDHSLQVAAAQYLPVDGTNTPTGEILPVDGTRYDYRTTRSLTDADPQRIGCDASVVLDSGAGPAATLSAPNGMGLRLWTDRPTLQIYTTPWLSPQGAALPGQTHEPMTAICLEAQDNADAMTHGFPSVLHGPETPYRQLTTIEIAPRG